MSVSRPTWNGWTLNADGILEAPGEGRGYPVRVMGCTSSAATLDWITQIAHKVWANDAILAGLVRALDDILKPQANLCSFEQDLRMTKTQTRELVEAYMRKHN